MIRNNSNSSLDSFEQTDAADSEGPATQNALIDMFQGYGDMSSYKTNPQSKVHEESFRTTGESYLKTNARLDTLPIMLGPTGQFCESNMKADKQLTGFHKNKYTGDVYAIYEDSMPPPNADYTNEIGTPAHKLYGALGYNPSVIHKKKEVEAQVNPAQHVTEFGVSDDPKLSKRTNNELAERAFRSVMYGQSQDIIQGSFDTGRDMYDGYNLKAPHSARVVDVWQTNRSTLARDEDPINRVHSDVESNPMIPHEKERKNKIEKVVVVTPTATSDVQVSHTNKEFDQRHVNRKDTGVTIKKNGASMSDAKNYYTAEVQTNSAQRGKSNKSVNHIRAGRVSLIDSEPVSTVSAFTTSTTTQRENKSNASQLDKSAQVNGSYSVPVVKHKQSNEMKSKNNGPSQADIGATPRFHVNLNSDNEMKSVTSGPALPGTGKNPRSVVHLTTDDNDTIHKYKALLSKSIGPYIRGQISGINVQDSTTMNRKSHTTTQGQTQNRLVKSQTEAPLSTDVTNPSPLVSHAISPHMNNSYITPQAESPLSTDVTNPSPLVSHAISPHMNNRYITPQTEAPLSTDVTNPSPLVSHAISSHMNNNYITPGHTPTSSQQLLNTQLGINEVVTVPHRMVDPNKHTLNSQKTNILSPVPVRIQGNIEQNHVTSKVHTKPMDNVTFQNSIPGTVVSAKHIRESADHRDTERASMHENPVPSNYSNANIVVPSVAGISDSQFINRPDRSEYNRVITLNDNVQLPTSTLSKTTIRTDHGTKIIADRNAIFQVSENDKYKIEQRVSGQKSARDRS